MLDTAMIAPVDLAYGQGFILSSLSSASRSGHLIVTSVAVMMSLLVTTGPRFRHRRKALIIISWYALALITLCIFGAYALITSGTGST
jgi:hypothetical protein